MPAAAPRARGCSPYASRCPLCRVRCQPADVWLLFVSNEVQPDTTRHQARMSELELLLQQECQLELAAEQRAAPLRGAGRALRQQCEALHRRLCGQEAAGSHTAANAQG